MKKMIVAAGSMILAGTGLVTGMAATATATPETAPAISQPAASKPTFGETKRNALQLIDRVIKSGKVCDPKAQQALKGMRHDVKHAKSYGEINKAARKAAPTLKKFEKNPDCR